MRGSDDQPEPTLGERRWPSLATAGSTPHLLLVQRDRARVPLVSETLRAGWTEPLTFTHVERVDDANQLLLSGTITAVLIGEAEEVTVLEHVRAVAPDLPVLVLAADYADESAMSTLRSGAQDYVSTADMTPQMLRRRLVHAIERKRAEVQLTHRALQDPLTGLPNRALFMDRLSVALDRIRRTGSMIAVLFLDVDGFKLINDSLGHAAGDRVLTALAARLLSVLRPMDTVARFGGDEFILLFEGLTTGTEAVAIAERVQEVANAPISLGGRAEPLSVSIGVATASDPEVVPEELIRQADAAMYHAKARGGGGATIAERGPSEENSPLRSLSDDVEQQLRSNASDLRADLRGALERAELRVVYQPFFRFENDRRVWGFEALVRWQHPERGLIAPREFLPLAEEIGLLEDIGQFVLKETLALLRRLLPAHADLTAAVNLAHEQLGERALADAVATVGASGVEPAALCLEIPERTLSEDPDVAIRAAEVLRTAGVRVAVDDYGTGSVPLGDLRRLKADVLKIHESIVGELGGATADGAMVGAVVDLAHALGMKVVAEGVETDEQLLGLQTLGCDGAQGFLLCRPMRADQLEELITNAG